MLLTAIRQVLHLFQKLLLSNCSLYYIQYNRNYNKNDCSTEKNQLAQKVLQTEDKRILKTIDLLFDQEKFDFELSAAQKNELDKRLEEIEKGTASFTLIVK